MRWAGPKKIGKEPLSLLLGFTADPLSYCFDLGLPQPSESMFDGDPEMKRECLRRGINMDAKDLCADRRVRMLHCRGASGKWQDMKQVCNTSLGDLVAQFLGPGKWESAGTYRVSDEPIA